MMSHDWTQQSAESADDPEFFSTITKEETTLHVVLSF